MSGPAVTSATHYQAGDVPRRAAFDDLRVGQWVAVVRPSGTSYAGEVVGSQSEDVLCIQARPHESYNMHRVDADELEVTILRDVPAPPVTVRREDYDTLRAAVASWAGVEANAHARDILGAARALIDNAEGADQ